MGRVFKIDLILYDNSVRDNSDFSFQVLNIEGFKYLNASFKIYIK